MKKLISFLVSLGIGICFILLFIVAVDVLMFQSIAWNMTEVIVFLLYGMALVGMLCIMNVLNHYYDRADGYASEKSKVGRWCKNTVFLSLVLSFFYVLLNILLEGNAAFFLSVQKQRELILLLCVVSCTIVYYVKNYRKLLTRKTRIISLMKQNVRYRNRRYYFVVEEKTSDEKEVCLKGTLQGNLHALDEAYVYMLGKNVFSTRILRVKENDKFVRKTKEVQIEIVLKKNALTDSIEKYSVLSDVRQYFQKDVENTCEYPFIRGLITVYGKCHSDAKYMTLLFWLIAHSEWLMCAKAQGNHSGDIMDQLRENTSAAFMSVSTTMDDSLFILPMFTDWEALNKWKTMMLEKDAVTMMMPYADVVDIMEKGFGGIVINPFGPQPFFLPKELASSILELNKNEEKNAE